MNYLKSVTTYCFKNFWFLMLFAIIPAVYVGLLLNPFQFIQFLFNYPSNNPQSFADFFCGLLPLDWLTVLLAILGLVVVSMVISIMLGKIEVHFRIGKKNLSLKDEAFNNNFASVLTAIFVMAISFFVVCLFSSLLMMFFNFIFANNGFTILSTIFVWVIGIITIIITSLLTLYFGVAAIDMMIMGSNFRVALSNAGLAVNKNFWQNFFVALIPFVIAIIFTFLGNLLGIIWLTNILSLLVSIPFVCVFVMTIFFNYYGLTRYDIRPYYNLK